MSLSAILSSFLGFLAGLWGSTFLQDRETRRRQLGIVRALRAEVARIRREARLDQPEPIPISVFGATPVLPKPGSWIQSLLADIASTYPDVVTRYLELDRCLDNLKSFEHVEKNARAALEAAKNDLERAEKVFEGRPLEELGEAMAATMQAKNAIEHAAGNTDLAEHVAQTAWNNARNALGALDNVLAEAEKELAGGLWTHLPWRRRSQR